MKRIMVKIKPETISWEQLIECQKRAHESNKIMGINMQCASLTPEEFEKEVKNGVTLVAIDELDNLAGMLSINYRNVNRWWHKGEAAYICYVAVSPEFRGQGVYRALSKQANEHIIAKGVNVLYLNTHIDNRVAQSAYKKDGYRLVRFSPGSGSNYYSVEMAKWLEGKGKSRFMCNLMYAATEIAIRILYKPGKIRRF